MKKMGTECEYIPHRSTNTIISKYYYLTQQWSKEVQTKIIMGSGLMPITI